MKLSEMKRIKTLMANVAKQKRSQTIVTIYTCRHTGCGAIGFDPKQVLNHEGRLGLHLDHFARESDGCPACEELVALGDWSAASMTGRDDFVCRHDACHYYSLSSRASTRRQAVMRHQVAFPIHCIHFETQHQECEFCASLESDTAGDGASASWRAEAEAWARQSAQLSRRLQTKELANVPCLDAPSFAQIRDPAVLYVEGTLWRARQPEVESI